MKFENSWRYSIAGAVILVLPVLILFKLLQYQLDPVQRTQFQAQLEKKSGEVADLVPPRGQIYDRWGHALAGNQAVYEVGVEIAQVENPHAVALATSLVLGSEYSRIEQLINQGIQEKAIHVTLARHVTQDQYEKLAAMQAEFAKKYGNMKGDNIPSLDGLSFIPYLARTYPEKALASNVIGFVDRQDTSMHGVEQRYNDWLSGKTKSIWWPYDPVAATPLPDMPEGTSLILTIDSAIQASMEDLLDDKIDETGADSGSIIVLDPRTGEVLAMATTERMDLNQYWQAVDVFPEGSSFNRAINTIYEPGSVLKILTMAAGLDSGAVTVETEFLDRGVIEIGGNPIYNWNRAAWGPQSMQGCLQYSLNVCMAWIAKRMGVNTFYDYMQRFGLGRQTGVDLAGEVAGRLKLPGDSDWYESELGTNAFGQGVSATPLQVAAAVSAVANDGKMMLPHVVRSMISKGYQKDIEPQVASVPISAETAHILSDMLANSLENESSVALVEGYRLAGKTGTAEIPTATGYDSNLSNASFVGWGPVDDPRFLVYIWLEKPRSSVWASEVAAPVFSEAVERLVVLLDLPPDDLRQALLGQ